MALDAIGLFPRVTTWLGYRRDAVLRSFMKDFISLFAPHVTPELLRDIGETDNQSQVDALVNDLPLPVRGGCGNEVADAA